MILGLPCMAGMVAGPRGTAPGREEAGLSPPGEACTGRDQAMDNLTLVLLWRSTSASTESQQPPQRLAAPHRSATSQTVVAPRRMESTMVRSLTASQWQMIATRPPRDPPDHPVATG